MDTMSVYHALLEHHKTKGWWPIDHDFFPREFEIIAGAILTQNTNWINVEKALKGLEDAGLTSPEALSNANIKEIEKSVRPSGFFRQKAQRLKIFSVFIMDFGSFENFSESVTREELLSQKGIGPETADSILLYALGRRSFVIDAYTKRIFTRLGFQCFRTYDEWREFFESNVTEDAGLYREYHALIVEHAKAHCRVKPICEKCPLGSVCARKF
ncbi:MAG: endonuclease III domain-containing protein [Candidatus Aenigmarchaeota archaeon]|nr:endonuclease III domain-containing protein [Candidatus Aenigmarchaeota archaeon]